MKHFSKDELLELNGAILTGRIVFYDWSRGYGFARTEGRDIFLSSYQMSTKQTEKKLILGTKIKFKLGVYNEKPVAQNIEIIEEVPFDEKIQIGQKEYFIKDIARIGISNLTNSFDARNDLRKNGEYVPSPIRSLGLTDSDLVYLYVELKNKETDRYFDINSKFTGNGNLDITKEFQKITSTLWG